ncbi:L-threonylcarbamoyladenylate synthase [Gemmatimonadota bacterium]
MIERKIILKGAKYKSAWIEEAASLLERSAVVVHPTETVHGLGCRYDSSSGIERISRLKERPADKPMIFLVPESSWLDKLCEKVPETAYKLIEFFWPGPLTLILSTAQTARSNLAGLGETIAVRQCAHPFTAQVLEELKLPIVSTSLNRSGQPVQQDPQRSLDLLAATWKKEPSLCPELAVIDIMKSKTQVLPSTILSVESNGTLSLIRQGACPLQEISNKAGIALSAIEHS